MNLRKIKDKIRGTDCPYYALGWDEWEDWHKDAKSKHPFRYWLVEDFAPKIKSIINYPREKYSDCRCYIKNRFINKPHVLKTRFKAGQWVEYNDRLLYGMIDSFTEWVETELVPHSLAWKSEKLPKNFSMQKIIDELDVRLEWLKGENESQHDREKVIKEVYVWAKNFKEIDEDCPWSKHCELLRLSLIHI